MSLNSPDDAFFAFFLPNSNVVCHIILSKEIIPSCFSGFNYFTTWGAISIFFY